MLQAIEPRKLTGYIRDKITYITHISARLRYEAQC